MTDSVESRLADALELQQALQDEIKDRKSQTVMAMVGLGLGASGVVKAFIGNAAVGLVLVIIGVASIPAFVIFNSKLKALTAQSERLDTTISTLYGIKAGHTI